MEVASIFLNRILSESVKTRASSLRLSVGSVPVMRVDEELLQIENVEIVTKELLVSVINQLISEEEFKSFEEKKEIIVVKDFPGGLRFRISVFFQKGLPSIVFHGISGRIRTIDSIDLPPRFIELARKKSGLIVVAGSFSSGKTSTIASLIDFVNKEEYKYISTLENPIEHVYISQKSVINQRQIGRDVVSFCDGVSFALRDDVDMVVIGNCGEEFEKVIPDILNLASGNSLVVLEINARSAHSVLEKILSSVSKSTSGEAARYTLADVLLGVLVQKLLPKKGGEMVLACEFMIGTQPLKSLIREGKLNQIDNIIESSATDGMLSMKRSINNLKHSDQIEL